MLEGLEPGRQRFTCKVAVILEQLDKKDQEILMSAISDTRKWGAKTLQKALATRGIALADTTITKHRLQACRCYQEG